VGPISGHLTPGVESDILYSTFISGMLFWSFSLLQVTVQPVAVSVQTMSAIFFGHPQTSRPVISPISLSIYSMSVVLPALLFHLIAVLIAISWTLYPSQSGSNHQQHKQILVVTLLQRPGKRPFDSSLRSLAQDLNAVSLAEIVRQRRIRR